MFNKSKFRKKVLLSLISHPFTLYPFAGGATLIIVMWILGLNPILSLFLGGCGFLMSVGGFFTNLLVNLDKISKEAFEELQTEAQKSQEESLDSLDQNLQEDGDARTESLLRELRSLTTAFKDGSAWSSNLGTQSAIEIDSKVRELFQGCVAHLERTLELWRVAQKLDSQRGSEIILNERERMIKDVESSVEQLGHILAGVLRLGLGERDDTELARIRSELDQSLEVARRVEERMRSFDQDKDSKRREE